MEEDKNGEQLSEDMSSQSIDMENEKSINDQIEEIDEHIVEGSLGKFKDAESLLKAYNNLQAEFTKKCQSLSKLKNEICDEEKNVPVYTKEDWTLKVSDFFEKNKDAKPFSSEIANKLIQEPSLATREDALEVAWAQIASKNYVAPQKLLEDESFIEDYVLKNEKVKDAVLKSLLNNVKTAPPVMTSSHKGGRTGLFKPQTATTLSEAKEIVKNLFN